nr:MAG TPA: hypothetical protein [Caudoviricetes sp.]
MKTCSHWKIILIHRCKTESHQGSPFCCMAIIHCRLPSLDQLLHLGYCIQLSMLK